MVAFEGGVGGGGGKSIDEDDKKVGDEEVGDDEDDAVKGRKSFITPVVVGDPSPVGVWLLLVMEVVE